MTQDPFSMWDDASDSGGDFLGDGPPATGVDLDFPLHTEVEELEVLDADGRVVGVIDLS